MLRTIIFTLITIIVINSAVPITEQQLLPEIHEHSFYYFGYGSNLLANHIHIQNPTAKRVGLGFLKDFCLDFNGYTERWDGAPATIVPSIGAEVSGAVWLIDLQNLDDIDKQEGVHEGIYVPLSVPILLSNGSHIMARTYQLVDQPKINTKLIKRDDLPVSRQPSKTYLQCLVKGAMETGIAESYINWLKSIKHNGKIVPKLEQLLDLSDVKLSD